MRTNLLWYIRLFAVLIISVLLFFILLFTVYSQTSSQIRQEAVERQKVYLQRGATVINTAFSSFWGNKTSQIQKLNGLSNIAKEDTLHPADYAQMITLRDQLTRIIGTFDPDNPFLLVFLRGDGLAISSYSIYHNLTESFREHNVVLDGLSYEDASAFIRNTANDGIVVQNAAVVTYASSADSLYQYSAKQYLCIVRNLHIGAVRSDAYALWLYEIGVLHDTLSGESATNDFFALMRGDEVIYTNQPEAPLALLENGTYYDTANSDTYFSIQLPSLGLTAYLSLNDAVVLQHLQRFSTLWNTLLIAFVLLCAALFVLLVFYLFKPLRRLYTRIIPDAKDAPQSSGNIFIQMEGRITELGSHRQALDIQLARWQTILHKNLLNKLLRGGQISPSEADILNSLPAVSSDQAFRVVLIGIFSQSPQTSIEFSERIERGIEEKTPTPLYTWMDAKHLALILPESSAQTQTPQGQRTLRTLLADLHERLGKRLSDPSAIAFGVGLAHAGIKNIEASYREARKAFREAEMWKRASIVYFEPAENDPLSYSIPYDELVKMQNMLETGNSREACIHLDALSAQLFAEDPSARWDELVSHQFYQDIHGMVLRISSRRRELSILSSFPPYDESTPARVWLEQIKSSFQYIAEVMASNKHADNALSNSLLEYIMAYYSDPAMSVATVAEAFSLSERSLSRYFKDRMEDTFSNILEKIRLSEAETLLLRGNSTMKDIACQIGYANLTTFLKAFKRRYGLTPSDWVRKNRPQG